MSIWGNPVFPQTWARLDSIVIEANTVLSENNGSRTPWIKTTYGEAAYCLCYNSAGTDYGGNWTAILGFAKNQNALGFNNAGGVGPSNIYSIQINGKTFYYRQSVGSNGSWGGSSTYTNPLGIPEAHNVQIWNTNVGPIEAGIRAIASLLEIQ